MGTTLRIRVPEDFVLARDVCSYGYFLLAPNVWSANRQTLTRPLELAEGITTVSIGQAGGRGTALVMQADRALSRREQGQARAMVTRMLWLDDDSISEFHRLDPRWKKSGRARIFRSPTFFEDVVKTITSCNVTWPGTMGMNRRLCEVINPAFPNAGQLARRRAATLRTRCRVGYRDQRLIDLARLMVSGELDVGWYEDPANEDEAVYKSLLSLPGVGPYAAANIMQLLGRYSRLAIDTETISHAKLVLGMTGTEGSLRRQLQAHYEPFGRHKFRSYWFELWTRSESRNGPAWTWEATEAGRILTAKPES